MVDIEITENEDKGKIRRIVCNRCDNTTKHFVCSSLKSSWDSNGDIQGIDKYEIIRCSGCDEISFRIASSNSEESYMDEELGRFIHPEKEEVYPNRLMGRTALKSIWILPEKVRLIYKETHSALCSRLNILAGVGI